MTQSKRYVRHFAFVSKQSGAKRLATTGEKKPGSPFEGRSQVFFYYELLVPTAGFEPGDLMITLHPLFQLS